VIKIRYRDADELSPGLHAAAVNHGRDTTVYLLPGLTTAERRAALRRLRPVSAMTSSAGPAAANGQASSGGNDANTASPPATEMSSAQGHARPPKAAPRLAVVTETVQARADITLAA